MGNSQWERDWNGLHNWESRAHRLHEVIGTQHQSHLLRYMFYYTSCYMFYYTSCYMFFYTSCYMFYYTSCYMFYYTSCYMFYYTSCYMYYYTSCYMFYYTSCYMYYYTSCYMFYYTSCYMFYYTSCYFFCYTSQQACLFFVAFHNYYTDVFNRFCAMSTEALKNKIYKTGIRHAMTCGRECWAIRKCEQNQMNRT